MTEAQLDKLYDGCNVAPISGYVMHLGPRKFFISDSKLPIDGKRLVFEIWDIITAEEISIPHGLEMRYM